VRTPFSDMPGQARDALDLALGSAVVGSRTATGGWAPGVASLVTLANGETVFVKAAQADAAHCAAHRREAYCLARLPTQVPAPHLRVTIETAG
jgi:hypothetical protein